MALSTATVDESTFVEESELSVVRHGCRGCWPGWRASRRYRLHSVCQIGPDFDWRRQTPTEAGRRTRLTVDGFSRPLRQQVSESLLVENGHAEFDGLVVFRSGGIAGDDVVGLFRHRPGALAPPRHEGPLGAVAGEAGQRAGHHDRQPF